MIDITKAFYFDGDHFFRYLAHEHEKDGYFNEIFAWRNGGNGSSVLMSESQCDSPIYTFDIKEVLVLEEANSPCDVSFHDGVRALVFTHVDFPRDQARLSLSKNRHIECAIFYVEPFPAGEWLSIIVAPLRIDGEFWLPARVVLCKEKVGRLHDLTHHVSPSSPFFPGGQKLLQCPAKWGDPSGLVVCGCDVGTHVDSPRHFFPRGKSISDLSLRELCASVIIIDVRSKCKDNVDYIVSTEDIEATAGVFDGSFVIARTGWSSKFVEATAKGDATIYSGMSADKKLHFPGYSAAAAALLVKRNVVGIGIDTLSLDPGISFDFPVHVTMLGSNRYQVENLNLATLPETIPRGTVCFVLPHLVTDAGESMARVFLSLPADSV